MMGPALSLLFTELDKRKEDLTLFETDLHQELLSMLMEQSRETPKPGLRGAAHLPGKLVEQNFGLAHRQPRPPGISRGGNLSLEVDLSGSSGVPQLQINCSQTNCPNKKRT